MGKNKKVEKVEKDESGRNLTIFDKFLSAYSNALNGAFDFFFGERKPVSKVSKKGHCRYCGRFVGKDSPHACIVISKARSDAAGL